MDKTCIHVFGKSLRRAFRVPDDLPYPMRQALEALAAEKGDDAPRCGRRTRHSLSEADADTAPECQAEPCQPARH